MSRTSTVLSVVAVVEAIGLFGLLFVIADDGQFIAGLAVIAGIVLLCVIALRLIGSDSFRWLSARAATWLLLATNLVALPTLLLVRG